VTFNDLLEKAKTIAVPAPDPDEDILAHLDESLAPVDDALAPDPKPASRKPAKAVTPSRKITAAEKKKIQDSVELMLITLGGGWSMRDRHCGPALVGISEEAAAKAVPIIARNPTWVSWFVGSTGFLDFLGLAMALKPFFATVWGHHVTHTVGEAGESDGGDTDLSQFPAPEL
jgi:hypothetical protein